MFNDGGFVLPDHLKVDIADRPYVRGRNIRHSSQQTCAGSSHVGRRKRAPSLAVIMNGARTHGPHVIRGRCGNGFEIVPCRVRLIFIGRLHDLEMNSGRKTGTIIRTCLGGNQTDAGKSHKNCNIAKFKHIFSSDLCGTERLEPHPTHPF